MTEPGKIIKHKVLQDIQTALSSKHISADITCFGFAFTMTTLTGDEEVWANNFLNDGPAVAIFASLRPARIAASIKSIGGVPVSQLFSIEKPNEAQRDMLGSADRVRYHEMAQVMKWLVDLPAKAIDDLWLEYTKLNERRDATWTELKNS